MLTPSSFISNNESYNNNMFECNLNTNCYKSIMWQGLQYGDKRFYTSSKWLVILLFFSLVEKICCNSSTHKKENNPIDALVGMISQY